MKSGTKLTVAKLPQPGGTLYRIEVLREQDKREFPFLLSEEEFAELRTKGDALAVATGSQEFTIGG